MKKNKQSFIVQIIRPDTINYDIVRSIAKEALENVLAKNGAVADNLDEVLHKYISGEMCNGEKS